MGGVDKAFLKLGGATLIERAIARARPQVDDLIINASGDLSRFDSLGCQVIADRIGGFLGPLAGILSGFEWMRANRSEARWLASFACDCPFFPGDMVERLIAEAQRHDVRIALAASGGRHHPVFAGGAIDVEHIPITGQAPDTDAEHQSALGQVVQEGNSMRQGDWVVVRQKVGARREFDPLC